MVWFRIDDGFDSHRKTLAAGNTAVGLWTRCGTYAAGQLTDGYVPGEIARMYGKAADARRLVAAGLWHEHDHTCNHEKCGPVAKGDYLIHDFLEYNRSRAEVLAEREAAAERQRRFRERSRDARRDANRDSTRDRQRESSGDHIISNGPPDPTRPDPGSTSQTSSPPPGSVPREPKAGGGGNSDDDDPVLQAFVDQVLEIRPEWSRRAVIRALMDEDVAQRPWPVIQAAMLAVARDPKSHAPGRLLASGPWWSTTPPATASASSYVAPAHLPVGDPRPETRQRGVALARQKVVEALAPRDNDAGGEP